MNNDEYYMLYVASNLKLRVLAEAIEKLGYEVMIGGDGKLKIDPRGKRRYKKIELEWKTPDRDKEA